MKAMILAAGLGTRLRPLTDDRPKALVEVAGRTMLEMTLSRLREYGVRDVIVNVHHFAGMIVDYLKANRDFGMHIEISREDDRLLDTGGGLKKASWFFESDTEPFILHNVDVVSTIDLDRMVEFHRTNDAVATLAVKDRPTSRPLLFDENLRLRGRGSEIGRALAFSGIHVISSRLFPLLTEEGAFSIISSYLRLAPAERILGFRSDEYCWRDLGRIESIRNAFRSHLL